MTVHFVSNVDGRLDYDTAGLARAVQRAVVEFSPMDSDLGGEEADPFASGLGALLQRAGILKTSVIHVAGEGGLQALLWLCRHGYQEVGWLRGVGPAEPADAVLAPCAGDAAALNDVLTQAAHLPAGGVLLMRARPTMGGEATAERLSRSGFSVVACVPGRHRDLFLARRCSRAASAGVAGLAAAA